MVKASPPVRMVPVLETTNVPPYVKVPLERTSLSERSGPAEPFLFILKKFVPLNIGALLKVSVPIVGPVPGEMVPPALR